MQWAKKQTGFTIVELLIVIVVIAILAAITIVSYTGIQQRTYDSAIQSDLNAIGKKIVQYEIQNSQFPTGATQLSSLNLSVTKGAYDTQAMLSGSSYYNLVYCWPIASNPNVFTLVAKSKSGAVFQYKEGSVTKVNYSYSGGSIAICNASGVTISNGSARDWFFSSDAWQPYIGG